MGFRPTSALRRASKPVLIASDAHLILPPATIAARFALVARLPMAASRSFTKM